MFKFRDNCLKCPIRTKIMLYSRAGEDDELAQRLNEEQRLGNRAPEELREHFRGTAVTIYRLGCQTRILCRKNIPV